MEQRISSRSNGLNTREDPARSFMTEAGILDLAACQNIDIDKTGRTSRRKGWEKKVSLTSAHSLFKVDDNHFLCVSGEKIVKIDRSFSIVKEILTVTTSNRVSFERIDEAIFFMNGRQKGIIVDDQVYDWVYTEKKEDRVRPEKYFDPPIGTIIGFYRGRMYVAEDRTVWYSEPYEYDAFAMGKAFLPFETKVLMLQPVENGIFISDEEQVHFLGGRDPESFDWKIASEFPALQYSNTSALGQMSVNAEGQRQFINNNFSSCFWLANKRVFFGAPDGNAIDLVSDKIIGPTGGFGGIYFDPDKRVLVARFF